MNPAPASPRAIDALASILNQYDALFVDIWGVLHNGRAAFAGAVGALQGARRRGLPVVLVSNVPKPNAVIPPQLDHLGVPRDAWDTIVTSGDVTREALRTLRPGPFHRIGPPEDAALWVGLDLEWSDIGSAAVIAVSGLDDPAHQTGEDYRERLSGPAARGVPLVCANPDRVVRLGNRLYPCAGAIADVYEDLGGRVVMAGKPHTPIFEAALVAARALTGEQTPAARILMIGDGPKTDVLGANSHGHDCLFIADGIHGAALTGSDPSALEARAHALLAAEGAHARWVMPRLG
jgi:HAD superfamily hydrolase (TIGR01459 family)